MEHTGEASGEATKVTLETVQANMAETCRRVSRLCKTQQLATYTASLLAGSGTAKWAYWTAQQNNLDPVKLITAAGFIGGSWLTYTLFKNVTKSYNTRTLSPQLQATCNFLDHYQVTSDTSFEPTEFLKLTNLITTNELSFSLKIHLQASDLRTLARQLKNSIAQEKLEQRLLDAWKSSRREKLDGIINRVSTLENDLQKLSPKNIDILLSIPTQISKLKSELKNDRTLLNAWKASRGEELGHTKNRLITLEGTVPILLKQVKILRQLIENKDSTSK